MGWEQGARSDGVVGRDHELALVREVVEAAVAGRPSALLVSGEAGVGKTSLLRAACRSEDLTPLWASCPPLTVASAPFLVLRGAVRQWARRHGAAAEPGLDRLADLDPGEAGLLVEEWLDRVAEERPVALVVDDVQWADPATWDLLKYLFVGCSAAEGRRLAVLLTARTGESADSDPFRTWLADVRRFPTVEEMVLGRLDRVGTREQVRGLVGGQPFESLVDDVQARSHGNPYLTALLLRGLPADARSLPFGLPDELTDAVTRLWKGLSEQARELTRLLALGGGPQPSHRVDAVASAAGLVTEPVAVLREAVDGGVLVLDDRDRYWFSHPLMPQVLVGRMLPEERRHGHIAYLKVLADEPAPGSDTGALAAHWSALSEHHLAADELERATDLALRASETAATPASARGVLPLLRSILAAWEARGHAGPPDEAVDRVRVLAERAGDQAEELRAVETLLRRVDRECDPLSAARLLVRRMGLRLSAGVEFAGLADVREAVRLSEPHPDSAEHALALAELAHAELWHGVDTGEEHAVRSVEVARASGDPQALAYALTARVMARVFRDDPGGLAEAETAQRAAFEARDWWAYVHAAMWHANSLDCWDTSVVLELVGRAREVAAEADAPHCYVALLASSEADGLLHLGRWRECTSLLKLVLGSTPGPMADTSARLVAAQLACLQGRLDEAGDHLARADELFAQHSDFLAFDFDAVRSLLAVAAADTETAVALAPDPANTEAPPTHVEWLVPLAARALADRVERCRREGRDAAPFLDRLAELRLRHPVVPEDHMTGAGYARIVRAMQAWYDAECARADRSSEATGAWRAAADACAAASLPWDEAYARFRLAEAALGERSGRAVGSEALRTAYALAVDLHAQPLLADIEGLATTARVPLAAAGPVGSTAVVAVAGLGGLTGREREILSHVVAGRTYAQMARELFISEKTVSVHISNVLRKTGTSSRVELARLAMGG
ncbi:MAG TPA: AAA family ATPase [Dermatophilaceae bacterium]|nr:AAA family ATPase [Dermatophilaceae bacterium]